MILRSILLVFTVSILFSYSLLSQDVNTTFEAPDDSEPFKYGLGISNYSLGIYLNAKLARNWDTDYYMQVAFYKNEYDLGSFVFGIQFNRYWDRNDEFAPVVSLISGIVGYVESDDGVQVGYYDEETNGFTIESLDLMLGTEAGYQFNPTKKWHLRLTGGVCYVTNGFFYPKVTFGVAYAF
jgi:hypothetical protein